MSFQIKWPKNKWMGKKGLHQKPTRVNLYNSRNEVKTLKMFREKQEVTYKRLKLKVASEFSIVTLETRSQWNNAFWILVKIISNLTFYTQSNHESNVRHKMHWITYRITCRRETEARHGGETDFSLYTILFCLNIYHMLILYYSKMFFKDFEVMLVIN